MHHCLTKVLATATAAAITLLTRGVLHCEDEAAQTI